MLPGQQRLRLGIHGLLEIPHCRRQVTLVAGVRSSLEQFLAACHSSEQAHHQHSMFHLLSP
jgi:hypothetical protein